MMTSGAPLLAPFGFHFNESSDRHKYIIIFLLLSVLETHLINIMMTPLICLWWPRRDNVCLMDFYQNFIIYDGKSTLNQKDRN